jgi:hypothetical protein
MGLRTTFLSELGWFSTFKGRNISFFIGRYLARRLRSTPAFSFSGAAIRPCVDALGTHIVAG